MSEEIADNLVIELEFKLKIIAYASSNDRYLFIYKFNEDTGLWRYVIVINKFSVVLLLIKYKLINSKDELKKLRQKFR